ncbi:MAG TPA: NADH-quinone oxidoreductase subunit N [Candidatus Dormibacteraeota bacterium]|jgi:NADH-quinone oxidoreductase subunit N|nr:NADH-quinone oxidoreductase subunit N [Candidatus Dormibacteraeota bacterium]
MDAVTAPPVAYTFGRALSDLSQIAPIACVTVTLLVAVVVDLVLPRRRRGPVVAGVSIAGLLAALGLAVWAWYRGGGHSAYFGFVTGDRFAVYFEMLFASLGVLTVLVAHVYVQRRGLLETEFHVLTLAAVVGMMTIGASTSLVSVFLGLETFSVALYVACGFSRAETTSQEAAAKYLLVGGFASAIVLYGMALLYGAAGSTDLSVIAGRITGSGPLQDPMLLLGVLLLGVGFAFKVSGVPFHQWTPDVYQGAPLPVTAFMSVGTKAAAFAMILRVFDFGLAGMSPEWQWLLAAVAAASMIAGNVAALVQTSVKRLLAYSGIAQAGYVLIGVVTGGRAGIGAVLFYLFVYLFMNFGAFVVLTPLVTPERERDRLSDLDGLGFRHALSGVMMSVFMLSLAGFPPLVGFWGKLYLFTAGVAGGWTWLVVIAVLASVVSVAYYLRVVLHVWTPLPEAPLELSMRPGPVLAMVSSGILSVVFGIYSPLLLGAALAGALPILGH